MQAIEERVPETDGETQDRISRRKRRAWLLLLLVVCLVPVVFLAPLYVRYSRLIDAMRARPFADVSSIYAAPRSISPGEEISETEIVRELLRAGYSTSTDNPIGRYDLSTDTLSVYPGRESYFASEPVEIRFKKGKIAELRSLSDGKDLGAYRLEPELVTALSEEKREKRRLVRFAEIPKDLVNAVVATEDKRFFSHLGFDPFRIAKAAYVDLREGRKEQGASTLSMQLARNLWLDSDKRWRRKISELLITMLLEEKLTKEEIFESYANQVYLGRRGSFSIHGFGEAAWTYFSKDIRDLKLAEAATLAGLVQRPGFFNPLRKQDRLLERRNVVLGLMKQNGFIGEAECQKATESPLDLHPSLNDGSEAPYYVDLVNAEFNERFPQRVDAGRIYTSLDLRLQQAANEAISAGMKKVDAAIAKLRKKGEIPAGMSPQVALIALDPHTGEVKALAGGRNYTQSQLNRALAMRQPGSIFKPFVYAAALNTAVRGGPRIFTPASTILDAPATFQFAGETYEPGNFHQAFYGTVTLRRAMAKSMNVATVKLAEQVGYGAVVDLARQAGLNDKTQPTPAVALGAYDATPLEMAGAYTVFANDGVYVRPSFITAVRGPVGSSIYRHSPETREVLTRPVNYLMVSMLEEVMQSGTAAGVHAMGFNAPAGGKTGTSRDGWFAGFTSNLLCVVWVGFDDGRELELEGSKSALPVWAEFMKRALKYYPDAKPFKAPPGVDSARICTDSGALATEFCPNVRNEYFVRGSEPQGYCSLHTGFSVPAFLGLTGEADRSPVFSR